MEQKDNPLLEKGNKVRIDLHNGQSIVGEVVCRDYYTRDPDSSHDVFAVVRLVNNNGELVEVPLQWICLTTELKK